MPASQARSETRLPRAVMRIAADVQSRIDARNKPPESEPDPNLAASTLVAAAPAEATPPAPAPTVDPRENDPKYWKQRFQVVDGRIRAVEAERKTKVSALRTQIAELQESIRTLQAKAPVAELDLSRYFTPEQIEKYGEEQCRITATAAQAAANDRIQLEIETRIKPLTDARKQDQVDAAASAKREFEDKLTELVPNWREVDADRDWLDWLAQVDEPTQLVRQEILTSHCVRHNAQAAARMFEAYEKTKTPMAPPMTPHGTAASTPAPSAPAQPAAAGGAPTDAEVKDFYKRAALGKVQDKERVAFEARMKQHGRM